MIQNNITVILPQTKSQHRRIRHFVIIHIHQTKHIPAWIRLLLHRFLSAAMFPGKPFYPGKIPMTVPFQYCCFFPFHPRQIIGQRNRQMTGSHSPSAAHQANRPEPEVWQAYRNLFFIPENTLRTVSPPCPNHWFQIVRYTRSDGLLP